MKRKYTKKEKGSYKEIYKPLPSNTNYLISSAGRVFSIKQLKHIGFLNTHGYMCVTIDGRYTGIHRLVMETFSPEEYDEALTVNHRNGDKRCNLHSNLEMMSQTANFQHAVHVLRALPMGKNHSRWKGFWGRGDKKFETIKEAASGLGVSTTTVINNCRKGVRGYYFEPVEVKKCA